MALTERVPPNLEVFLDALLEYVSKVPNQDFGIQHGGWICEVVGSRFQTGVAQKSGTKKRKQQGQVLRILRALVRSYSE